MNTCTHARHVIKKNNKSISSNGKGNNQHRYNSYILNTVNQFDTHDNYPTWVLL